jgi:iron(III) transport system substrate-binding protein
MKRKPLPIAFIVVAAFLGCSSGPRRTPLVVYSPHGKDMLAEFEKAYEANHPDQDVQWMDMGSQDVYDRIRTERNNPQADLWWGAPSITFMRAERESLLAPYVPSWDSAVGTEFRSVGHFWYGTFLTPEIIMYNNRVVQERDAPSDWDDLLDARWHNKIIVRSPLASGTMRIIYSALLLREKDRRGSLDAGFAWLRRLDANTKTYVADPTQLYLKIAREEGLITLWNLPDVIIQVRRNNYPFGYKFPRSGTPLITDGIAIVRGAPHPLQAREFYEFVTSQASMIRQAAEFGRIPVRRDIPRDHLPGWVDSLRFVPLPVDWDALAGGEREWMKKWDGEVKGRGSLAPE